MEKSFENMLREMNEAVQADDSVRMEVIRREVELIIEMAEAKQTAEDAPSKVLDIQKEKARVMGELKEQLSALDDPQSDVEYGLDGRTVGYDESSDNFFVYGKGGVKEEITLGELMTGGEWGQEFKPDKTVPRMLRNKFLVHEAHRKILDLLDTQIVTIEEESWFNKGTGKDKAYAEILADSKKDIGELPPGILAEKMVYTLMSRLSFDADLPFDIRRVDAYADVEEKIDFVVHIKSDALGVRVAREGEAEKSGDVGVQFTTRSDEEGLHHKDKQIQRSMREMEKVKRIVLVSVPLERIKDVVGEWFQLNKDKKTVGGPDKLLDKSTQEKVFRAVLAGLFSDEDVEVMWHKVISG